MSTFKVLLFIYGFLKIYNFLNKTVFADIQELQMSISNTNDDLMNRHEKTKESQGKYNIFDRGNSGSATYNILYLHIS